MTFPIPEKCLVGVIGPSGAGKSTLLGALTGMRPADRGYGAVRQPRPLPDYDELRYRIGLVPQENILHTQLTARRALQYSAELRFPADTSPPSGTRRVDEVMEELGLTEHADTRADRLSGGQLKRVNVAQELLTKPSLLFLDEPTSGLDPGLDKTVMGGCGTSRTTAGRSSWSRTAWPTSTPATGCLSWPPAGRMAYYGPPGKGSAYFGQSDWAEVFQAFERYPDRDWAGEFAASPTYARYVPGSGRRRRRRRDQPRSRRRRRGGAAGCAGHADPAVRAGDRVGPRLPAVHGRCSRRARRADLSCRQRMAWAAPEDNLDAQELLLILVVCACLAGTASSVRELVKERPIYIRERRQACRPVPTWSPSCSCSA